MSKRRLSIQQKKRILAQNAKICETETIKEGLVICRYKKEAFILSEQKEIRCTIRPHLETLACGDRVLWHMSQKHQGVILKILPRKSTFQRLDRHHNMKTLAANITQMFIVIAATPEPSWLLLDSYLVFAELNGFKVTILHHKCDLSHPTLHTILDTRYRPLNYKILETSRNNSESLIAIKSLLKDEVSIFTGQSGVGKSTLLTMLCGQTVKTQSLSHQTGFGQHTTSLARLYPFAEGGALIDSPGIREFGLPKLSQGDILDGFRELRPLAARCLYRNCDHQLSEGCEILAALRHQLISKERYLHWLKLTTSCLIPK